MAVLNVVDVSGHFETFHAAKFDVFPVVLLRF
jgi:hypothetical protein